MTVEAAPLSSGEGRRYPSPLVKQDLARLGKDAENRRAALISLRSVVEEHLDGSMLSRFLQQVGDSPEGRRHAPALAVDLARAHGTRLLPHLPRLLQILSQTLLASAAAPGLQADCAGAVAAIARHCGGGPAASAEEALRRLCLPLTDLLSDKVEPLSTGAAACLRALVESEHWKFAPAAVVSRLCLRAAMALATKCTQTVAHMSLLRALAAVSASTLSLYDQPLLHLLAREILPSSSSWQLRRSAVSLLEALLRSADPPTLAASLRPCADALARHRHDRMPLVRKAVIQALRTCAALAYEDEIKRRIPAPPTEQLSAAQKSAPAGNPEPLPFQPQQTLAPADEDPFVVDLSSPRHVSLSDRLEAEGDAEPDYFCAFFYDRKDKPGPCRKVVHHIHDGRQSHRVPPLPISSIKPASDHSNSLPKSTPSTLRDVAVLNSNEDLLASCERSSGDRSCRDHRPASAAVLEKNFMKPADAHDSHDQELTIADFQRHLVSHETSQSSTQKHVNAAMEDFQAICDRLLEIREQDNAVDAVHRAEEACTIPEPSQLDDRMRRSFQTADVNDPDEAQEEQLYAAMDAGAPSDHNSPIVSEAEVLPQLTTVYNQGALKINEDRHIACPMVLSANADASTQDQEDQAYSLNGGDNHHHHQLGLIAGDCTDAETTSSNGDQWSVRDNPIADEDIMKRREAGGGGGPASLGSIEEDHDEDQQGAMKVEVQQGGGQADDHVGSCCVQMEWVEARDYEICEVDDIERRPAQGDKKGEGGSYYDGEDEEEGSYGGITRLRSTRSRRSERRKEEQQPILQVDDAATSTSPQYLMYDMQAGSSGGGGGSKPRRKAFKRTTATACAGLVIPLAITVAKIQYDLHSNSGHFLPPT